MKTERIYIRVTPELKEKLRQAAEKENRDITNFVETVLKQALENEKERH